MIGILGKKVGMTRFATPTGDFWPVTIVDVGRGKVTDIKNLGKHGYDALQIGISPKKAKHANKPETGHSKKSGEEVMRHLREYRITAEQAADYKVGQAMDASVLKEGDYVDVHARSVGKGFQGVIKRWGMARGPETHGSMSHREVGSIGMSATPSRTLRGQKLPGHMGNRNRTEQNLLVVKVLKEDNLVLIKGAVPGPKNGLVSITKAIKKEKIELTSLFDVSKGVAKGKKTAKK